MDDGLYDEGGFHSIVYASFPLVYLLLGKRLADKLFIAALSPVD